MGEDGFEPGLGLDDGLAGRVGEIRIVLEGPFVLALLVCYFGVGNLEYGAGNLEHGAAISTADYSETCAVYKFRPLRSFCETRRC